MADLKICSIWAARLGLVISIITQINGKYGTVDNIYAAVIITSLIFAATFAPEPYYATASHHGFIVARGVAVGLFLALVTYTTAITALLINKKALSSLATLIRASPLEVASVIFLIVISASAPYVFPLLVEFWSTRTHQPVAEVDVNAEADVDEIDSPVNDPPVNTPPVNTPPVNSRTNSRTRRA